MLTAESIESRRALIAEHAELQTLAQRVRGRVERILQEMPEVPRLKALLSRDGGVCPEDGSALTYDPWSPSAHRCPACGREWTGERHDRHWARAQHLWLAERALDLAALAALEQDEAAGARAVELLTAQGQVYQELPNQDNVLGPTHLFFSTYLESMWVTNWLGTAFLLREAGHLPDGNTELIDQVAEEAALLIGEFNEGLSNRQVWNATALTVIAAWFNDEELAQNSIETRTGLLGLLADGFEGSDGLWWEGENYHLFALRGMMLGIHWARVHGIDLLEDPELRRHFELALLAPTVTALPDLTFPARKDSRFGVSLAQPAFLELWEIGRSWIEQPAIACWLGVLYRQPAPAPEHYDAWLHDSGLDVPERRSAADLSAWALLEMQPSEAGTEEFTPASCMLLESQGLALLRQGDRYVSLECGSSGGGHGHPDRLHLTLHAHGVHWLPDPGTASYVSPSLFWYRSPRAHNAPSVDGESPERGWCEAFDNKGDWHWARGRAGEVQRTIVAGPDLVVDIVQLEGEGERTLELPWHLQGEVQVVSQGKWTHGSLDLPHDFIGGIEQFQPSAGGPVVIEATRNGARIRLHLSSGVELLRATGPGLPGERSEPVFYLQRVKGNLARLVNLVELSPAEGTVLLEGAGEIKVQRPETPVSLTFGPTGVQITAGTERVQLGGLRPAPGKPASLFTEPVHRDAVGQAPHAWSPPVLDGTLDGFDLDHPLTFDNEDHYRRSEEPYDPERIWAEAWVNWDLETLYLAVHVRKPEVVVREADSTPLELDNEPDDIHQDGVQLYLRWPDDRISGFVIVPDPTGGVRFRALSDSIESEVSGAWSRTDDGYVLTVGLKDPRMAEFKADDRLGFDLLINEMTPERVRRLGQLVWSGGGGWVYLRGDRQDPGRFGVLELL